jgi:hypothetical protein
MKYKIKRKDDFMNEDLIKNFPHYEKGHIGYGYLIATLDRRVLYFYAGDDFEQNYKDVTKDYDIIEVL